MKKTLIIITLIICILISAIPAYAGVLIVSNTSAYNDSEAMYANLDHAIASLNGRVIEKGKPFSFNEIVGARTLENGFAYSPNGNGAMVQGGGVSQIATTMYQALRNLESDITFDEIHHFGEGYTANYADSVDDTVLTDYARKLDFQFTSNHSENLSLSMWRSDDIIYCQLTGVGNDPTHLTVNEQATIPVQTTDFIPEQQLTTVVKMQVVNVDSYVNLRSEPSTKSESLMKVTKDSIVEYLGKIESGFCHVRIQDKEGYVAQEYLKEVGAVGYHVKMRVVNCNEYVSMRAEPFYNASTLAKIPLGAEVEYIGDNEGDFKKVSYEGNTGYVLASYLSE